LKSRNEAGIKSFEQNGDRNYVHIGDTVLKSGGNEGGDGKEYGKYFTTGSRCAVRHPNCQTNQHVAEDSKGQGSDERVP